MLTSRLLVGSGSKRFGVGEQVDPTSIFGNYVWLVYCRFGLLGKRSSRRFGGIRHGMLATKLSALFFLSLLFLAVRFKPIRYSTGGFFHYLQLLGTKRGLHFKMQN